MQKNLKNLQWKNQPLLNKFILLGFVLGICYIIFSSRSHSSDIKNIYKQIEKDKRQEVIKDSLVTDSLVKIREEKLLIIADKLERLQDRQEETIKKLNKKYETKINYIYTAPIDTNRSIFNRNFSKKIK